MSSSQEETHGDENRVFEKYINAMLAADLPQLKTIRIGTKSLSFWPYRYLTDPDAEQMLNLFRRITDRGIHLAFMAHFNHHRELETDAVREAVPEYVEPVHRSAHNPPCSAISMMIPRYGPPCGENRWIWEWFLTICLLPGIQGHNPISE